MIGLPLAMSVCLYLYRKSLDKTSTRHLFGFLYNGYEADYFWWEVWVIVRKSLVMLMAVVMVRKDEYNYLLNPESQHDTIQLMSCTAVMAVILIVHLVFRPYEADSLDLLELLGLFAVLITYIAALAFASVDAFQATDGQYWGQNGAGLLLTLVVLLAHAAFMGYMLYLLVLGTGHKLDTLRAKEHIERVKKTKNPRPWIRLRLTKQKKEMKSLQEAWEEKHPNATGKKPNPAAIGPATRQIEQKQDKADPANTMETKINIDPDDDAIERHDADIQYDEAGKPEVELDDDGNVRWRVGMAVQCCCTIVPHDRLKAAVQNPWFDGKVLRSVQIWLNVVRSNDCAKWCRLGYVR